MKSVEEELTPFENIDFDYEHCFICGIKLTEINTTKEHIFPDWLQQRYSLGKQTYNLTNGTTIQYNKLLVPCCSDCNHNKLSPIEGIISKAEKRGYRGFLEVDQLVLYQWIAKIYYGLLFKDLNLKVDRSNPDLGTILTKEEISEYRTLHFMLQSTRYATKILGNNPWSIFIFSLEELGDKKYDFDFGDTPLLGFFIRMKGVGIVCVLEDNGHMAMIREPEYKEYRKYVLSLPQFDEFVAQVFYTLTLQNRTPKYVSVLPTKRSPLTIVPLPLQGMSSKPVYKKWDNNEYAEYLSFFWNKYTKITPQQIYEDGMLRSELIDYSKQPLALQSKKRRKASPHKRR